MHLNWPLKGVGTTPGIYVTQWFGENYKIYHDAFNMNGHNGIDIGAPLGTPVYAPHDGFIIENVQKDSGYGLRTQIYFEEDGFGWEVILGHFKTGSSQFEEISYNQGNRSHPVKAGDLIALVNSTGFSTGNHCHIGLKQYKNGQLLNANNGFFGSIDPKPYLQGAVNKMNQTKVALGKDGKTVWICTPVSTMEVLKERAAVEGFDVPTPIPPTASL
jgi:murein DD-endopeptidase MepM/ murein hydrolase activator NlpD